MKLMKVLTTLSVMLGVMMVGNSAYAATPANALLKNTASLTYTGSGTLTASVTVTVQLVRTAAIINGSAPSDESVTENQTYTQIYKITAQANGPDEYSAVVNGTPTNVTGSDSPTVTVTTGSVGSVTSETPAAFNLGATALAVTEPGGEAVVRVPDDNTPGAGDVNGLAVGDTVVFDGSPTEYIISTITYPGSDQAEITFTTNIPANAIGTGIFEVATITTTVDDVGTADVATPNTINVTLTVEPTATPGVNTFTDSVLVTVEKLDFIKYVRNVTQDTAGTPVDCTLNAGYAGGSTVSFGGEEYCSQGVEALPGQVLAYYIKVTNAGTGTLADVTLADVLDEFTTYNAGTTAMNGTDVDDAGSAPVFPLDSANGGGLKLQSSGFTTAADGDGVIGAAGSVEVIYQVTVNNLDI